MEFGEMKRNTSNWSNFGMLSRRAGLTASAALSCNYWHPGTLTLRAERQSAQMSIITNDGLTRSGTGCFIGVPVWQQWTSKG